MAEVSQSRPPGVAMSPSSRYPTLESVRREQSRPAGVINTRGAVRHTALERVRRRSGSPKIKLFSCRY
eukprot:scaffold408571_cov21-Prasinocladus_malaysianus.AAC.1